MPPPGSASSPPARPGAGRRRRGAAGGAIALDRTTRPPRRRTRPPRPRADAAAAAAAAGGRRPGAGPRRRRRLRPPSYMEGTPPPAWPRCSPRAAPAELMERAALLEAAGAHRTDVLVELTVLQEQAATADRGRQGRRRGGRQLKRRPPTRWPAPSAEVSARAAGRRDRRPAGQLAGRARAAQADPRRARGCPRRRRSSGPRRQRRRSRRPPRPRRRAARRRATPRRRVLGAGTAGRRRPPAGPVRSAAQTAIAAARSQLDSAALRLGRWRQQRPRLRHLDPTPGRSASTAAA